MRFQTIDLLLLTTAVAAVLASYIAAGVWMAIPSGLMIASLVSLRYSRRMVCGFAGAMCGFVLSIELRISDWIWMINLHAFDDERDFVVFCSSLAVVSTTIALFFALRLKTRKWQAASLAAALLSYVWLLVVYMPIEVARRSINDAEGVGEIAYIENYSHWRSWEPFTLRWRNTAAVIPKNNADAHCQSLRNIPNLCELWIQDGDVTDASAPCIRAQRFERLALEGTKLTPAAVCEIIAAHRIEYLYLSGNQLDAAVMEVLARPGHVAFVQIDGDKISDDLDMHFQKLAAASSGESGTDIQVYLLVDFVSPELHRIAMDSRNMRLADKTKIR